MVLDRAWNETTLLKGHQGVRPVHLAALALAIINFLLNGLIWFAFRVCSRLLTKCHLHLFYAFAITNSLTGFFSILTFTNLIIHNNLYCPRWTIIIGSGAEMGLDRMRGVLAIGIAAERLYAISRPRTFFLMDHASISKKICIVGVVWSVCDMIFMVVEDDLFEVRVHCVATASSGIIFHAYYLIFTIVNGGVLLAVYLILVLKFISIRSTMHHHHRHTTTLSPLTAVKTKTCGKEELKKTASLDERNNQIPRRKGMKDIVNQANSLTLTVILCVLLFSVMPGCMYVYDLIVQQIHFMSYGPVVTIGYHLHGIVSSFCYNYKHRDIRNALDRVYPIRRAICFNSSHHNSSSDEDCKEHEKKPVHTSLSNLDKNAACSKETDAPPAVTIVIRDIIVTTMNVEDADVIL